jgi:Fibronectin type III domain
MALEGTVKLPVFGTVKKKTAAGAGFGSVVLVIGIYWWRQRQAANAAAASSQAQQSSAAAAGTVTDPAGNVCASTDIDPSTGFCSGTAADLQAQQEAASDDLGDDEDIGDYGDGTGTGITTTQAFSNNAAWAQAAEAYLGSNGADSTAAALSKYLLGQQITTDQEQVVEEAIAAEGYPPVAGANGYPPSMNVTGGTSPSPATGSSGAPAGSPPNLKAVKKSAGAVSVSWGAEGGEGGGSATSYSFGISPAPAGGSAATHNIGNRLTYNVGGLKTGTTYTISVAAVNSAGTGPTGHVSYKA